MYFVAYSLYRNIIGIKKVFEEEGEVLDWTVFRIAGIPGGSDEESWKKQREGEVFAGGVAEEGWKTWIYRSQLARWLVENCVEGGGGRWVGRFPAISSLREGKAHAQ